MILLAFPHNKTEHQGFCEESSRSVCSDTHVLSAQHMGLCCSLGGVAFIACGRQAEAGHTVLVPRLAKRLVIFNFPGCKATVYVM